MSGVLLSVAVYALLRYRVIASAALDPAFVRTLLLTVALASLALAASMLLAQRDYKRLLAYSSIEHMGLVVVGVAAGTRLAVAALLLHILGHGLGKAVLFCGSGQILAAEGTTQIAGITGLLARRPVLGATFALGLAALLGLPPFSLFASQLALARAVTAAGLGWAVAVTLILLLVVFVAVAARTAGMLLGRPADPDPAGTELPRRGGADVRAGADVGGGDRGVAVARAPGTVSSTLAAAPLVTGLVALSVLGTLAWPLAQLLRAAAAIAGTP
jgi:hydrogenase-4 component F